MNQGNQSMMSGINEVTCLEYGQLKIHYEILNKKFRAAQKTIDQHNFYFKRNSDTIDDIFKRNNSTTGLLPLQSVASEFKALSKRLGSCLDDVDTAIKSEIQAVKALNSSAEYLKQGTSSDPNVVSVFRKQRANRFIIEHLLRNGYFETAQKLADYVGTDNTNKNVFHVAKQVEESLKRRDLSICLHWILDNRSKLHRLHSPFENEVRIQQLIELIKDDKRLEAVAFLKTHFGNNNSSNKWNQTMMKVMGLLAYGLFLQKRVKHEKKKKEERVFQPPKKMNTFIDLPKGGSFFSTSQKEEAFFDLPKGCELLSR